MGKPRFLLIQGFAGGEPTLISKFMNEGLKELCNFDGSDGGVRFLSNFLSNI